MCLCRCRLSINKDFVASFAPVQATLTAIQADVNLMGTCCREMTDRLNVAKSQTAGLIARTNELKDESDRIDMQAKILDKFLSRYQLSPGERAALDSEELSEAFFGAIGRIQQIHDQCKVLLRTNVQQAGLSIMESMATLQESSYERLYRWTHATCRGLTQESSEHPALLIRAMHVLRDRPVLFDFCVSELSSARHTAVARTFIAALTRGGVGGTPRPIEMHSHDPIRYASDMLAWIHQAAAAEHEQFLILLLESQHAGGGSPRKHGRKPVASSLAEAEHTTLKIEMSKVMEGVCRPLQVRIDQILAVRDSDIVTSHTLATLLKFYSRTLGGLTGSEAEVLLLLLLPCCRRRHPCLPPSIFPSIPSFSSIRAS